jgi:predicted SnoaL-like aldol condensation-catalyzing enzyme
MLTGDANRSPQEVAARYFEMWNTGNASIAAEILSSEWVDHAHPEATGPQSVQQAVKQIRTALPGLRFQIPSILSDGDLVAVIGAVSRGGSAGEVPSRLIWLIRLEGGQMAEMWTYRDTSQ